MNKLYKRIAASALAVIIGIGIISPIESAQAVSKSSATNISYTNVNDDPGAGRLSGENISEDFFESDNNDGIFKTIPFAAYGSSSSVSTYTGKTYTHQDQFDGYTIVNGVDVSYYQETIDWAKAKAAGIDFAIIRAGYRGYSAGTLNRDTYFDSNMDGAAAAGVGTGIYIFSQATSEAEAEEEAQFILDRIGTHTVNMPIVLDFEFASNSSGETGRLKSANLSKDEATNVCLAFCNKISAAGYTPMVYANYNMLTSHLNADVISASYPIWLANYTTSTKYTGKFSYWQYSSSGKVDGIKGSVDMNFYYCAPDGNIASAVISPVPDQKYTGQALTPDITVSIGDKTLTKGTDFTVAYSNNTEIGKATITVTGIGQYNGTRTLNFNIYDGTAVPEITGLSASTKTKNYITLQWDTASNITGYELYRSSSPNGEYALVKKVTKASTTTFKNTKLTEGQCYYYKIRAYRETNGVATYGEMSGSVGIYTKTSYTRLALPKSNTDIYSDLTVSAEVVSSPAKNSFVNVTYCTYDDTGAKWYRVSYDGTAGFIPASRVTAAKQGKVKTKKVNVRKKSKVKSKKLTTVGKNKKVAVIKTKKTASGTWYNVIFKKGSKTYKGWIYSIYVKI